MNVNTPKCFMINIIFELHDSVTAEKDALTGH